MKAIGEVISSSISASIAERWDVPGQTNKAVPGFGTFLKVQCSEHDLQVFAVVTDVITGPRDSVHKPAALQMSRAELRKQQPQIFSLLKTELHVVHIGYEQAEIFEVGLPPHPPQIHDFIYLCSDEEIRQVTADPEYLRRLAEASSAASDELLAAAIQQASKANSHDYGHLVQAGQFIAQYMRDDFNRLSALLRKIQPR